jgi:cbb3-type cytochrome oxidase subunit 3
MNLLRSLVTISLLVSFIALWIWAWRAERRADFAAAARLALEDGSSEQAS